jgi:hypothetical protein
VQAFVGGLRELANARRARRPSGPGPGHEGQPRPVRPSSESPASSQG